MAALAELIPTYERPEQHTRSLRAMRLLGHVAASGCAIDIEHAGVQEAWRDFISGAEENLTTDPEYGKQLKFEPLRSHRILDDHVVDSMGQRLVDLVKRGAETSRQAAQSDPEMYIQAERDEGDEIVAEIVDSLNVGELYAVVSMEPKGALRRKPDYWRGMGYREGLAVAQVYYRSGSGEMLGGAYSIKQSDKDALRNIFASFGVEIPEGESENRWIRYGIRRFVAREEAENFGKNLVKSHQRERGQTARMVSVTELFAQNQELTEGYFRGYIVPLAKSHVLGETSEGIQNLAQVMLQNGADYEPAELTSLMRIAHGLSLRDEDVSFMEEKIRYALVEELRTLLPIYRRQPSPILDPDTTFIQYENYLLPVQQNIAERLALNIARGMSAGRAYGGCMPAGKENQKPELGTDDNSTPELQDVFGGKAGEDQYGPLKFQCKNGHWNERPRNTLITQCHVEGCKNSVGC